MASMKDTVILALDTSGENGSVALLVSAAGQGAPQLFERALPSGPKSSQRLLPAVDEVLGEAGLRLDACDAIGFGAGPGSFTGLRIAAGATQGLAFGIGCPVLPVSTLEACAQAARERDPAVEHVVAALDARMDEVYWASYAFDLARARWRVIDAPSLADPLDVRPLPLPFTLAGNAAEVFGARLGARAAARAIDAEARPGAAAIARIALLAWRAGEGIDAAKVRPLYLRDKVAFTTLEREAARLSASKAASVGDGS